MSLRRPRRRRSRRRRSRSRCSRRRRRGRGWCSRRRASSRDPEPRKDIRLLHLDIVRHARGADGLEVGAVDGARPSGHGGVALRGRGGRAVPEDVGPLLDGLVEVVVVQRRITDDRSEM